MDIAGGSLRGEVEVVNFYDNQQRSQLSRVLYRFMFGKIALEPRAVIKVTERGPDGVEARYASAQHLRRQIREDLAS